MRSGVIATKVGMSSLFCESGKVVAVTLLKVDQCQILGFRSKEKDGYNSVILGSCDSKKRKKSISGFFALSGAIPKKIIKEFRTDDSSDDSLKLGAFLLPSHFLIGQKVDVSGKSIGKGFAGAMKRHNFRGLESTHGVSISHRSHGSTGSCQDPGKVFKNKKMAGHLGCENVTVQNLEVMLVDDENSLIYIKGAIPGFKNSTVFIKDAVKK